MNRFAHALELWFRDRMFLHYARRARRDALRAERASTYPNEVEGWERSAQRNELRAFRWAYHLDLTAEHFMLENEDYPLFNQEDEDDD